MTLGEQSVKEWIKRKVSIPSSEETFFYVERQHRREESALQIQKNDVQLPALFLTVWHQTRV